MISAKKIYFIGIGGAGMSSQALWLKARGFDIAGSDVAESEITKNLRENGISVQIGHKISDSLKNSDLVVYSSAIKNGNDELDFAQNSGKTVIKRAEMLGIMADTAQNLIAVCGSAGKSSTTGFTACVLNAAEKEPSVIVGGVFAGKQSGMQIGGRNECFLAEADEFDRSFLNLKNIKLALCTGIEAEHLDVYKDFNGVKNAFIEFFANVRDDGLAVLCNDSDGVREIYSEINCRKVSFGLKNDADYRAKNIRYENGKTIFEIHKSDKLLGNAEIKLIGEHNVLNALGAIAAGLESGIDFETAAKGVSEFGGIKRRIEKITEINGISVFSDYSHHPTKISAALNALQKIKTDSIGGVGRIITLFQPHTFTRTRDFAENFASALEISDVVLLTEIYPAREKPIEGISEKSIAKFFKSENSQIVAKCNAAKECAKIAEAGDIIVVMGAGDIDAEIGNIIAELKNG